MKTLNLSDGFAPVTSPQGLVDHDRFRFNGGEMHIKLKESVEAARITTRLNNADDVLRLLLAVDALRRSGTRQIEAFIPYLPYARQDRVMVPGEPLSVKVMCDLLNSCDFDQIYLYDVHSEVAPALLNHCQLITNHSLVEQVVRNQAGFHLVAPDAGALKKIYRLAAAIGYHSDIVLCNKIRDVRNGQIRQITVDQQDLAGRDCIIVDDICDGGATFIGVAKALKERNAGKILLVVSHGIFAHGETALAEWIDHIYTTDSISDQASSFITRLPLSQLIPSIIQ